MSTAKHNTDKIVEAYKEFGKIGITARKMGVDGKTVREHLQKAGLYKAVSADYICPQCGKSGAKHKSRNLCGDCVREYQRKLWHDKKSRSIDGNELVQSGALNGWQAVMSSEYLRKSLMVSV